ncbi:DUF6247 family protein [Pseudonocardia nematodicida]|uniref:DUF6247 family protein n=1 Tax=Pseudonocardia nematodicida TaxID=1206997 RepID=A0ABV1KFC7_9PSEU
MSATYSVDDTVPDGSLRRGASPRTIRAALIPEDRTRFDAAYADELATARDNLDLTGLFAMLERWRRVAVLQRDPDRFDALVRRAAELRTGEPASPDETTAETRRRAGL